MAEYLFATTVEGWTGFVFAASWLGTDGSPAPGCLNYAHTIDIGNNDNTLSITGVSIPIVAASPFSCRFKLFSVAGGPLTVTLSIKQGGATIASANVSDPSFSSGTTGWLTLAGVNGAGSATIDEIVVLFHSSGATLTTVRIDTVRVAEVVTGNLTYSAGGIPGSVLVTT